MLPPKLRIPRSALCIPHSFAGSRLWTLSSRLLIPAVLLASPLFASGPTPLAPFVVTSARSAQSLDTVPFNTTVLTAADLTDSPALTLDGALRQIPAFSLFRRNDSLTAHPTAQGVSLRGIGPSGASRTLILLDGIPLNDPFGGWVNWSQLTPQNLAGAELVRGGGSGTWGNAALGGTLQFLSRPLTAHEGFAQIEAGDFSTLQASASHSAQLAATTLRTSAATFETDGPLLIATPGSIDQPAHSRHSSLQLETATVTSAHTDLHFTVRSFTEARSNGTPLQQNTSRSNFASAQFNHRLSSQLHWQASAYAQRQHFSSVFSSINATRTTETPASEQFDVPSSAAGASLVATWLHTSDTTTTFGADTRWVTGETRENVSYSGNAYTRQRIAGGTQLFTGLFLHHHRAFASSLHAEISLRADRWTNTSGHRHEISLLNAAVLRDDHAPSQHGHEFSPSLGFVWQPVPKTSIHLSGYRAFRLPTLNEYHRPFRVGNVITEANPALDRESLLGAETGLTLGDSSAQLSLTGYVSELRHAVANLTLARGPLTHPIIGFIPAGGTGRQRQNLDSLHLRGLELSARLRPLPTLDLTASAIVQHSEIAAAPNAPALLGLRLAQVPRWKASAQATWRPAARTRLSLGIQHTDTQFDDDENRLPLARATTADVTFSQSLTPHLELKVAVENLANRPVETGRPADGVVTVSTPRFLHTSLTYRW